MRALLLSLALAFATGAPAVSQTAHVARAALFAGESRNIPPQTSFRSDTAAIELRVLARDVTRGSTIAAIWTSEKTGTAEPTYEIKRLTITFEDDRAKTAIFTLSRPNAGWPVGQYRVELSFNGGPVEYSERFMILGKLPT